MDFEELRAFLAVAEHGSFLSAADALGVSRTMLRRQIDALEVRSGVALFLRTRQGVEPTEAGQLLARGGRMLVQESSALLSSVREAGRSPSGCLTVALPTGLPAHVLVPLVGILRARHPRLSLVVKVSEDPAADLLGEVDVAVCFGVSTPSGPWETHNLLEVREWLVASEGYLQRHGMPQSVEELAHHTLLSWDAPGGDSTRWTLLGGGFFAVAPALTSPDIHFLRICAASGIGIAFVPDGLVPEAPEATGRLVPVLPGVVGRKRQLQLIVPAALSSVPKIRSVIEIVTTFLAPMRQRKGSE
jgi:DNA-binding transcriptional LysR family regulator